MKKFGKKVSMVKMMRRIKNCRGLKGLIHPVTIIPEGFLSPKVLLITCAFFLSACQGGGGGGSLSNIGSVVSSGGILGLQISGVGADGPVIDGNVDFQGADDRSCGDVATTDSHGDYTAVISPDCTFPMVVNLSGGYDLVSQDNNYTEMYSVALDSTADLANITPLTTIIYYAALTKAQNQGESTVTGSNLDFVTKTAMRYFNFGIDSAVDPGFSGDFNPLTIKIGGNNACVFVKASEGLMETVRRTALYWSGNLSNNSINEVLKALGDDIADGTLDGLLAGGSAASGGALLASLWNINAATVSMELMQNQFSLTLQNGTIVTASDTNNRLLNAASKVADSLFANDDINNVDLSYSFIRQAKAAALVTDTLEGGGTVYGDFASLLDTMAGNVKLQDNGLLTVDSISAQQSFDNASPLIIIPADSAVEATVNDMGTNGTSFATYDNALAQSGDTMKESTPVLPSSRKLHIEWSYPNTVTNQNGFKIYMAVNNATPQVCTVTGATVRSADCPILAAPGDSVDVYMTATTSSGQESGISVDYSNTLPAAKFNADNTAGTCPLSTDFNSSGTSSPDSGANRVYSWDFADGNIEGSANPTHQFSYNNSYNVLLTVSDTVAGIFTASGQAELGIDCL